MKLIEQLAGSRVFWFALLGFSLLGIGLNVISVASDPGHWVGIVAMLLLTITSIVSVRRIARGEPTGWDR